jgi:hypothetical protein
MYSTNATAANITTTTSTFAATFTNSHHVRRHRHNCTPQLRTPATLVLTTGAFCGGNPLAPFARGASESKYYQVLAMVHMMSYTEPPLRVSQQGGGGGVARPSQAPRSSPGSGGRSSRISVRHVHPLRLSHTHTHLLRPPLRPSCKDPKH